MICTGRYRFLAIHASLSHQTAYSRFLLATGGL